MPTIPPHRTALDATTDRERGGWLTRPIVPDHALLLFRVWYGAMMMQHGSAKVFGGMEKFTGSVAGMGFPAPEVFAWAAALSELAGGALILLGLGTRVATVFAASTMAVAGLIRHGADPFQKKELALTYLILAAVLFLLGPGRLSLDAWLRARRRA